MHRHDDVDKPLVQACKQALALKQKITGFHKDELDDWVAELECRHTQHLRHDPPWLNRPWVLHESSRAAKLGEQLQCVKCDRQEPPDLH